MNNLSFEEGYKEFTVNGDPTRIVRFNPADFGMLERFEIARGNISIAEKEIGTDVEIDAAGEPIDELTRAAGIVTRINKIVREQIDFIFNSPVSDVVFGNQSPLSMVGGVPFFQRFLNAAEPFIEKELKAEQAASQKRVSKYTKGYKK